MVSFEAARSQVLGAARPGPVSFAQVDADAVGRFLAEPLVARVDSPPFTNSAVDGYGVIAADGAGRRRLVAAVAAGETPTEAVGVGEAARVLTGAPVPTGVDAVAMQEECQVKGDSVVVPDLSPGANVRQRGEEYRAGDPLLPAGTQVTPAVLGLLAANGVGEFASRGFPSVEIVATGSELVPLGQSLGPGQVYDSNGVALAAAVRALGGDPRRHSVDDDSARLRERLRQSLADADVLITTGGVSVGDRDLVKETLEELGVVREFWRIHMKPGKPVYFGTRGHQLIFGLPGNPVSALVTFHLLVRPALLAMAGATMEEPLLPARLGRAVRKREGRAEFVRGRLANQDGALVVTPTEGQGSHMVGGIASADALIHLPAGECELPKGAPVPVSMLRWGAL